MNTRIQDLLIDLRAKKHVVYRRTADFEPVEQMAAAGLSPTCRAARRLSEFLAAETPVVRPAEQIVFLRTVSRTAPLYTETEWQSIKDSHYIHEAGRVCNICPDYASAIGSGLVTILEDCRQRSAAPAATPDQIEFYQAVGESIGAILDLTDRYRQEALRQERPEIAAILAQVPAHGARTLHEALQALRILHFTLWCEGEYHNTLGRFDQYLYPYYLADRTAGRLDEAGALALIEDFFIALNLDSDLYPGIQQGDNGQSLMLGGVDQDGRDAYNDLSRLCLQASCELKLIDPKINLRVNSRTPLAIFEAGTRLTREGLGFPQYSNDDVVIPGLISKGYSLTDARNYTVAACWEFIIPKYGMDIPNIGAVNMPKIVNDCVQEHLTAETTFAAFLGQVDQALAEACRQEAGKVRNLYLIPAPFMSILMDRCQERGQDISRGARYNNYGLHGVGLSTAVDALAAVKTAVFDEHLVTAAQLKAAMDRDFAGDDALLAALRYQMPKWGNGEAEADDLAVHLLASFSRATEHLVNERNGCFRAGTGSAMYYLWFAEQTGATAGGRLKGEAFAANYAPELFVKSKGPLSVIRSFTKPDLKQVINGGPLTLEIHASVFRNQENLRKVAQMIQLFVQSGGHQLQLNSIDKEALLAAQRHPEQYRSLIVRVWGWSAYFVELDKAYQDHVIARQEFVV
ncbi:MAG: pyruvate formate lyase family protein [Clostridiaceae bacterium]|nr:pyruvate formate lyase family protein [Clostridiaceae bacterium]